MIYTLWLTLLWLGFLLATTVVLVYSAHRGWCVWAWWEASGRPRLWLHGRRRQRAETEAERDPAQALPIRGARGKGVGRLGGWGAPRVTVQLPMYNEPYVAERVIRGVAELDWPRDRLQIQVLDDSTDETSAIVDLCCRELRGEGFDLMHVRRGTREGYKAGALREGLRRAKGDFLAIFDADFVPPRDFLQRTLAPFVDGDVGMVQACWSHLNEEASLLTRAQAMVLDGHFLIEHAARDAQGRWFNFNGTAGVWRREAIEAVGSWHSDTLTEDVDLSYRAQLAGWRFVFLPAVQCPAELPCRMTDLRRQQWRWTAGSIASARKLLRTIWRSDHLWGQRLEATVHLLGPLLHVALLMLALGLGPMMWLLYGRVAAVLLGMLFVAALVAAGAFYLAAAEARGRSTLAAVVHLPVLLMLAAGLSVNNTAAAAAGLAGRAGEFRRTPKLRAVDRKKDWQRRAAELTEAEAAANPGDDPNLGPREAAYQLRGVAELGLSAWCGTWAIVCLTSLTTFWAGVLLALFAAGLAWVGAATLWETVGPLWKQEATEDERTLAR